MTSIRETAEKFNTDDFKGRILFSETMANHTTFRIGGPAPLFIEPFDVPSLRFTLSILKADAVPYFVFGGGSNIVVSDKGFEGAVVSMSALCHIEAAGECVASGAGASVSSVVSFCTEHALSGLEAFAGLPGSAGGAVYMNARCFDVSVSDILSEVRYIDCETLEEKTYRFSASDWDYKISPFQNTPRIVTYAVFKTRRLSEDKKAEIAERCKAYVAERSAKGHYKFPSAGSVFKNNRAFGKPSGKIIDEAGLKGMRSGGAQVAPWHGNFIVNTGGATAADVRDLTDRIVEIVRQKTRFTLECEILFCGIR
ncbi:UDP-N-acetylmuramate dehydrogenase [Treponema sp. Marseille-Q4132]|uniref:UDP-N-acetylmuramate dehydrogenase n=1 Tax=Treponema sp. Marseille-Q4132 TaxID=2766701 RepID=UPI001652E3DB|nr:UDP-N-acetylmuramate dehydrogenase [Treponema sp. Marseille-Q4132]QNL96665.1 UDP-N-acetylmuramate dehydrogenase [Treponema sp. Marseille-Q4132]